jgi:hypothetical protein
MLAAIGIMLVLWLIPGAQNVMLPLQYLDTHLHEMGHALAAVLTGGSVDYIQVHSDGSGVTWARYSYPTIVSSAGYVGASLFGAALIASSKDEKSCRFALLGIAAILLIEDVFWLRGDLVGELSGFGYLVLFVILGLTLKGWGAIIVAQFIGLQQCLSSLQSVFAIVNPRILAFTDNDATIIQGITGIPAILWSLSWCAISLLLMGAAFAWCWKGPRRSGSPVGDL